MSIKILLADDSITIQKVIGIIFGGEEYSLTVVDNGKAAVEKALEIIPDILLIDALMPGMSGYEVCEQVRATPSLAAKPILLLTGSFEPFDETKAKNCGADDFIAKPFESQQIISKVNELCELSASRAFAAAPTELEQEEVPPALPEEPVAFAVPETTDQPKDIWEAFTPAEPFEEPTVLIELPAETSVEATDSSPWKPVEDQVFVLEEEDAAEETVIEESAFGDISLEDSGEAVAETEEPAEETFTAEETFEEEIDEEEAKEEETVAEAVVPLPLTLTEEQLKAAIAGVSKDVIERIVWEVVPDLAEQLIKEAIRRIKDGQ